jgi:hypothetical protein
MLNANGVVDLWRIMAERLVGVNRSEGESSEIWGKSGSSHIARHSLMFSSDDPYSESR